MKIRKSENAQMFLFLTDSKHQESSLFIFDFVLIVNHFLNDTLFFKSLLQNGLDNTDFLNPIQEFVSFWKC